MPNPASLRGPNQEEDPSENTGLVTSFRISIDRADNNFNTEVQLSFEPEPQSPEVTTANTEAVVNDMREKISAMGVIASKQQQEPKTMIMNGSEHNNKQDKSPRDTEISPPRDGPVIEVCSRNQLEVSPKQFLRINKLKAWIEKKATTVEETSPGVLKYKTPHFRAHATIEVPSIGAGEHIQIGWIQACTHMQFINTYGRQGVTSWEFPEVNSRKYTMVSDADGKLYPWYGAKRELCTIEGPAQKRTLAVEMNDNFFPQVTWHVPVEPFDRKPRLTSIHRKQKFYTCLAVRDMVSGKMYIYRTLSWCMEINIKVDPTQSLGSRAEVLEPLEQKQPKLLKHNITIPLYALRPPNANKSQALIWRPRHGNPKVVVPPQHSTMDINSYLASSQHLSEKFIAMTPNES